MMQPALEDFDTHQPVETTALPEQIDKIQSETEKMAAYEQGYQAGWDDAIQEQEQEQARISADFARNLQELSFTFFEARAHVIQSMEPLLSQMLETVFPNLLSEAVGLSLIHELRDCIAESADNPIELLVSPVNREALETLLDGADIPALEMKEESSLTTGQAFLRMGHVERQVDLGAAIEQMTEAVHSLFALNQRSLKRAG